MVSGSPETRFLGCIATNCPEQAASASPISHVGPVGAPIMIVHGENDAMVPHARGERLYQVLNKACREAEFISLPLAYHGGWHKMMTDPELAYGRRSAPPKLQAARLTRLSRLLRAGT